jgi:hypothetical protein
MPKHNYIKKLKLTLIPSMRTTLYIKDYLTMRAVLNNA